jgi:hypothetical protein
MRLLLHYFRKNPDSSESPLSLPEDYPDAIEFDSLPSDSVEISALVRTAVILDLSERGARLPDNVSVRWTKIGAN